MSSANITRVAAGIQSYTQGRFEYWLADLHRPLPELEELLKRWGPVGVITQWDPISAPRIVELGFPTVFSTADRRFPGVGCVDVDDEEVGRRAARHLLETGVRNFGYFGNTTHYSDQRLQGFRAVLRKRRMECSTVIHPPSMRRHAIEHWNDFDPELLRWLRELPKPIGIFAVHDPLGRCLAESCHELGIRIPEEVAIVTADNDELICGFAHPPLSSIQIPWDKIGFETARVMEQMVESGQAPKDPVLIDPDSVVTRLSSDVLAMAHPRVQLALRLIKERACQGLSVKELLSFVPISRRTLEQEFATHLRRTPREEIIRVRLESAKSLLSRTDLSMPIVAERCGFGSAERFSIVFHQVEGVPPTRYRERYRLGS